MQINIITLGTNDLALATVFYSRWFDVQPAKASNAHIKFFNFRGVKLALFRREALASDANINSNGSGFKAITLAINTDSKEEVDIIFNHGIECGATILKNPTMVFWGGYSGYLSDSDSNLWEIAWNPFFKKDKNGELIII